MIRCLDLFSGIGGFALGLRRAGGFETVGFCEIDTELHCVLSDHWPGVWIHDDIRSLTTRAVRERCGRIDALCGGFLCQDVSSAGKGAGIGKGTRSGLWREVFRIVRGFIRAGEPIPWLLLENVPALRTRGYDRIVAALERIGYAITSVVVGAWALGAPHKRDRVWIVAYRVGDGCGRHVREARQGANLAEQRAHVDGQGAGGRGVGPALADANSSRQHECEGRVAEQRGRAANGGGETLADSPACGRGASERGAAAGQPDAGGCGEGLANASGEHDGCRSASALRQPQRGITAQGASGSGRTAGVGQADPGSTGREERNAPAEPAGSGLDTGRVDAGRVGDGVRLRSSVAGDGAAESAMPELSSDHERNRHIWPARPGQPQHDWEEARLIERPVGAPTHGLPERLVRRANKTTLKAAGNAVVPQVVEVIGRWIQQQNELCNR